MLIFFSYTSKCQTLIFNHYWRQTPSSGTIITLNFFFGYVHWVINFELGSNSVHYIFFTSTWPHFSRREAVEASSFLQYRGPIQSNIIRSTKHHYWWLQKMKYIIAQKNSAGFKSAVVKQCRTWEEFVDYIYFSAVFQKRNFERSEDISADLSKVQNFSGIFFACSA